MIAGVADTHAAVWYLFGDSRLSARAKDFIDQAAADRRTIEISPISLAEVLYLVEKKNRLPASAFDDLQGAPWITRTMFLKKRRSLATSLKRCSRCRGRTFQTCRTVSSRRLPCISAFESSAGTVRSAPRTCRPSGNSRFYCKIPSSILFSDITGE